MQSGLLRAFDGNEQLSRTGLESLTSLQDIIWSFPEGERELFLAHDVLLQ